MAKLDCLEGPALGLWPFKIYVDAAVLDHWAAMQRAGVPLAMVPHVWELLRLGADPDKLLRAIGHVRRGRPRKLPRASRKRGAPTLVKISGEALAPVVDVLTRSGAATTDRAAIRLLLAGVAEQINHQSLRAFAAKQPTRRDHRMTPDELVASLQQRLSRHRRALHKST